MSSAVLKLIILTDEDTAGMITDHDIMTPKERDRLEGNVKFAFYDKHGISHQLHFIHAEEV